MEHCTTYNKLCHAIYQYGKEIQQAAELERAIQKIDGVDEATISFMTEKLVIECEEENKEEVMKKVQKVVKREEPDCTIEEV